MHKEFDETNKNQNYKINKNSDIMQTKILDLKKKFEDVSNTSIEHSLKISKAHSSMVERINEIRLLKKNQKNIVKEEDFNKLVFRFNTFSDIENIDRLNKYLIPKLEKFSAKCDDLIESNIQMKECVQKFDETMSLKASKAELTILKKEIERDFMDNDDWLKINNMHNHLKQMFENHDKSILIELKKYYSLLDGQIDTCVDQKVETYFKKYDKVE